MIGALLAAGAATALTGLVSGRDGLAVVAFKHGERLMAAVRRGGDDFGAQRIGSLGVS